MSKTVSEFASSAGRQAETSFRAMLPERAANGGGGEVHWRILANYGKYVGLNATARVLDMRGMTQLLLLLGLSTSICATSAPVLAANSSSGTSGIAQTVSSGNEKTSNTLSAAAADAKPDYSKEAFVIEQLSERIRFENDGTGRKEQTVRVRIQSDAGVQRWGQLRFGYNSANERLEIGYVRVLKKDGSVVKAGVDAVQELSAPIEWIAPTYSDYREKHVSVPGLRPGDTLEFDAVTTIHTPLAPGQYWMQHDFQSSDIVLDEQLEIQVPAGRAVKVKSKPGMEPKISDKNGERFYRWTSSHLISEDEGKNKDDSKNKKAKKKNAEDELPAVQLTTFASWEEVGRWYAQLEADRRVPSDAVRRKADALTKDLHSEIDKVEALYDYTAKNFRYVSLSFGQGRFQPHAADEVLRNQYGDCKDKHTLLASLLEAEHIHAAAVLINSGRKLDPDIPSPEQFNHAITMVSLGKDELWMDATTEIAPFRLLAYPLRKKQALVIPAVGVPYLAETPADPPFPDTENLQIDGKVDGSGTLNATVSYELRGDSELLLRWAFRAVARAQWQQVIEKVSSSQGLGKEVSEVKVSDPAATRDPFTFSFKVSKADYVNPLKKSLDFRLPLQSSMSLATADADDADSPDPIKLGPPNTRSYRIKLELPAKYTVRIPIQSSLKRDYGDYEAVYKLEKNVFLAERKLIVSQRELPSSRVQDYLAFSRAVTADLTQQVSLETTLPGAAELAAEIKPDELLKRGNEARTRGDYELAIEILKRATETAAAKKSAWNDLGLAYLDSRQDDLAISSFQKAIEINSYDPYAYNNLGRVYLRQRKYDDAAKWFNKQIEVAPLDKYAHGNLGIAYLEQHQYENAAPELEKAAALTPDSAEAQVRVGEAYLNLGQDAKAMSAFDAAAKISTTPVVWNNIAYRLTLNKVHLDIARRYAESAVTTTAAALRNLSLDHIRPRDPGLVSALAAYWDTLGWLEFIDGNTEKALNYLSAAWQLSQRAEIGDHLGQAYEKQGDSERAINSYALAMNARRPDTETRSRLARLAGGEEKVDDIVGKSRDDLTQQRSVNVSNTTKQDGKADFLVMLEASPKGDVSVEGARFVSGEEKLRIFTDALGDAKYLQTVPGETTVKILRRGTLSCSASAPQCTFLLWLPGDVRSVD